MENLRILAKHSKVTLVWMPSHKGIQGSELVNKLAKRVLQQYSLDQNRVWR